MHTSKHCPTAMLQTKYLLRDQQHNILTNLPQAERFKKPAPTGGAFKDFVY